jgi:hypothetical protein
MNRIFSFLINKKNKVKGGALYYAIFISFIVFLFCGFIITATFLRRTIFQHREIIKQIENNVGNIIVAKVYGNIDLRAYPKYLEGTYSVDHDTASLVEVSHWGAYNLIKASFSFNKDTVSKAVLAGFSHKGDSLIALYLTEKDNYLTFSGTSSIKGSCYLPKLGYKNSLSVFSKNQKPIEGSVKRSEKSLPSINQYFAQQTYLSLLKNTIGLKNTFDCSVLQNKDSLYNSFCNNKVLNIVNTDNDLYLSRTIEGNIRLISSKPVHIQNTAHLNHLLIYAPVITVEKGFKGAVQLFATDSIHVESNCRLTFPSFAAIVPDSSEVYDRNRFLIMDASSSIEGGILVIPPGKEKDSQLLLYDKTLVIGLIYCSGSMQLQGKVKGSVYASFLYNESTSGSIGNMLYNGVIDSKNIPENFIFPLLINGSQQKIITWLQ